MLYLNENALIQLGTDWDELIDEIAKTVDTLVENDYAQPLKPYLRFNNPQNRIIAMPAYVGGKIKSSGLKWIASFPANIHHGLPRAHSIVVLNAPDTGQPITIINTGRLSAIRTASVSGYLIRNFLKIRKFQTINLGIIGFGPIGQYHYKMCSHLLKGIPHNIQVYDIRGLTHLKNKEEYEGIIEANDWETLYLQSDLFITCTVSQKPYLKGQPNPRSLHLNVSLRDYSPDVYEYFKDSIIVDDWDEVCRENTDIEVMHKTKGLTREHTHSIKEVQTGCLRHYPDQAPIMFNPMGMAVFDIAIANFYRNKALKNAIGVLLD